MEPERKNQVKQEDAGHASPPERAELHTRSPTHASTQAHAKLGWIENPGLAYGLVALLSGVITLLLWWPLPLHLSTWHTRSTFGDSHVWAFGLMRRLLEGRLGLDEQLIQAGYPMGGKVSFLGWGPMLLARPWMDLLGPLGAYNVALLMQPMLAGLAMLFFLRQVSQAKPGVLAAISLAFAFGPFLLCTMGNGQLEKAPVAFYPLTLALLWRWVQPPKKPEGGGRALIRQGGLLLSLGVTGVLMSFSDPYFALLLPFLLLPAGVVLCVERLHLRWRGLLPVLLRLLLAGVVLGASFYPAYQYFAHQAIRKDRTIFTPALVTTGPHRGPLESQETPVAQPHDTLLGNGTRATEPTRASHVTYLVLPLLLVALYALRRGQENRALGGSLLLTGVVLAAGPQLVIHDQYQQLAGGPYYLPAVLLEWIQYPLARGGQFYRAIPLATLGILVLVASVCTRVHLIRARVWWVWALMTLSILDAVRAQDAFWPRPAAPVKGLEVAQALAQLPGQGAIISLPLNADNPGNNEHLLRAAYAQRATTALPRFTLGHLVPQAHPWVSYWSTLVRAGDATRARTYLLSLGFRAILWTAPGHPGDNALGLSREQLEKLLGPPSFHSPDGEVMAWELGPDSEAAYRAEIINARQGR